MTEFITPVNPFPGIRSYESYEDYLFFGREKQTAELIERLTEHRFIAVIGSSGCGKSSLIKAGLIPSLFKNKYKAFKEPWSLTVFRPGKEPFGNMATAIAETFESEGYTGKSLKSKQDILSLLQQHEKGLEGIFAELNQVSRKNRLLYIDQFEELFRYKRNIPGDGSYTEASEFIGCILDGVRQAGEPVYVVLSMRSDFVDDCTEFRGLTEMINKGYYLVPRMVREEVSTVITGPVKVFKGTITDRLVNRLLEEVGDDPDQLPILQHALMRTWDYWKMHAVGEEPIDISQYEAVGTMKEALSVHAEEIYEELGTPRARLLAEKLFKALIDFGEESKGTRRPTPMGEICALADAKPEEMEGVIEKFREQGRAFLMPPYHVPIHSDTVIDISHESLMRVWQRLKNWVEDELQSAQLYLRLINASLLYQEGKMGLMVNPELQLGLRWLEQTRPNATWALRYDPAFERAMQYLSYSKKIFEQEIARKEDLQKKNLRRTRRFALILGAASLISILFLVVALNMMFRSEANEKKALEKEKVATTESRIAEEKTQEAVIQKKISEQQQQIAEQQKIITEEQKDYAIKQQNIALAQTREAIFQRQQAEAARQAAIKARDDAETQRKEAVNQKQIADQERNKAEKSEQNAKRLRMIALARSMAIQSSKMQETVEGDLPALLALQAFRFNKDNQGDANDPDIYNALSGVADEKAVLRGHSDEVRSVALAEGKHLLASCSADGTVRIWDPARPDQPGRILSTLKKGRKGFRCVAFNKQGNMLAAGDLDGEVLLWKAFDNQAIPAILPAHASPLTAVLFSEDDKYLITSGSEGNLRVWDMSGSTPSLLLDDQAGSRISSAVYVADGKRVIYAAEDGKIRSLSLGSPNIPSQVIFTANKPVRALALSPDRRLLAAGLSTGLIKIWNLNDPKEDPVDLIGHISGINGLVFSPEGKMLASCCYDKTIRLWNVAEPGAPPIVLHDNDNWVFGITFSNDGHRLISGGADKTIRIFQVSPPLLADKICGKVKRNLSMEEWNKYIGADIPIVPACGAGK